MKARDRIVREVYRITKTERGFIWEAALDDRSNRWSDTDLERGEGEVIEVMVAGGSVLLELVAGSRILLGLEGGIYWARHFICDIQLKIVTNNISERINVKPREKKKNNFKRE